MVVSDVTPVWGNLGQTHPLSHKMPGARQSYCPSDVYDEASGCTNDEELFGMDNVMFPGIHRPDYAVNPLSGFGTVRIPDTESMGTVRIPDTESMGWFGQAATAPAGPAPASMPSHDSGMALGGWAAAAVLLGGAYFLKGNLKSLSQGAGTVALGMSIVGLANRLLHS